MEQEALLGLLRGASYIFAILGGSVAIVALRQNARTNRSKFILDLTGFALTDSSTRDFWYKLDYDDWIFELSTFRKSDEEKHIDSMLYKFSVIGQLLRNSSVKASDLNNIYPIVRQFFSNVQIREYLRFNMMDFWRVAGHTDFHWPDAMYLFESLTRYQVQKRRSRWEELEDCKRFLAELRRIPLEKDLRQEIALRIKYDRDID